MTNTIVPKVNKREIRKSDWFDKSCTEAKSKSDQVLNKWRRKKKARTVEKLCGGQK